MEGITIAEAKKLLGKRFLGVSEISSISEKLGVISPLSLGASIPEIPYTESEIISAADSDLCLFFVYSISKKRERLIIY